MDINTWFKENMKDWRKPISASGIMTALSCERKFLFANKWRLYRKARQYSAAVTFGKILHRLLQVGEAQIEVVHQEIIKQHQELLAQIEKGEDLVGDIARMANELHASYTKAVAVVSIFWERFPPKEYMETVCREERIEGEMQGVPVVGFMDWVVRDTRNGSVWIRDTKTTSRKAEAMLTGFSHCVQCRFYRLLALNRDWGKDVKGFILDIVKVPAIKLCGKDEKQAEKDNCSPMEAYIQRVKQWYDDQEEPAMQSRAIAFNEPVENLEIVRTIDKVKELWEMKPFPRDFSKDLTRGGCYAYEKVCPYYDLCSSDPVTWPSLIEQMYEVVPEHKDRAEEKKEEEK